MIEIKNQKDWAKKCQDILNYHKEKCASKENIRGIKWKVQDTANDLDLSVGYVSESIKLAKALPRFNGTLEKLTRENALKALKSMEE